LPNIELPQPIVLVFGGGLNTRRRPHDIDINECTTGENFDLDPQLAAMTKRSAFDLVATVPNSAEVAGYAQCIKRDGTTTTLIQAGTDVYQWDHATGFTSVGTVSSGAKLRGGRDQNFTLDELVLITDIALQQVVMTWDGTTFQALPHNLSGAFYAKYCRVHHERAFYGNIRNNSNYLPHVIVGSERENAEIISNTTRPASVNVLTDPFFLTTLDLKPINALEQAFGVLLISTRRGRIFRLSGSNAFDFAIDEFFPGAAVAGDEAVVNIGNDVAMGLPARIESLAGVINFGDVESDDLTLPVNALVENVTSWTLTYDRRRKLLYAFPDNQAAVYVMFKKFLDERSRVSPWAKWTTAHSIGFQPSCVMPLIDPTSGRDIIYFGDTSGNVYRFDGSGASDGGTETVTASRTSGLIRGLPEGDVFDIKGWIAYRKQFAATVTLTFLFAGEGIFSNSITVTLPQVDGITVYNGTGDNAGYYNGQYYYGAQFSERLSRQRFGPPGLNAWFQLKVDVESAGAVEIHEIGFSFHTAKQ
jgi:hypothetical protein